MLSHLLGHSIYDNAIKQPLSAKAKVNLKKSTSKKRRQKLAIPNRRSNRMSEVK